MQREQDKAKKTNAACGFSLVESIVAIAVLVFAITAALTVMVQSISFFEAARDRVTAFYLAQEALEHVRDIRDNNVLRGDPWLTNLSACVNGLCRMDTTEGDATAAQSCTGSCPALLFEDISGIYNHSAGTPTAFVREAHIEEPIPGQEASIEVEVRWQRRGIQHAVYLSNYLMNWQ